MVRRKRHLGGAYEVEVLVRQVIDVLGRLAEKPCALHGVWLDEHGRDHRNETRPRRPAPWRAGASRAAAAPPHRSGSRSAPRRPSWPRSMSIAPSSRPARRDRVILRVEEHEASHLLEPRHSRPRRRLGASMTLETPRRAGQGSSVAVFMASGGLTSRGEGTGRIEDLAPLIALPSWICCRKPLLGAQRTAPPIASRCATSAARSASTSPDSSRASCESRTRSGSSRSSRRSITPSEPTRGQAPGRCAGRRALAAGRAAGLGREPVGQACGCGHAARVSSP